MVESNNETVHTNLESANSAEARTELTAAALRCCGLTSEKSNSTIDASSYFAKEHARLLPKITLYQEPLQSIPAGQVEASKSQASGVPVDSAKDSSSVPEDQMKLDVPSPLPDILTEDVILEKMKNWAIDKSQNLSTDEATGFAFFGRLRFYSMEWDSTKLAKFSPFSNAAGAIGAWALYHDGKSLLSSKSAADLAYHGATSAADLAIAAGAIFNNAPSLRKIAAPALALGLFARIMIPAGNHVYNWGSNVFMNGPSSER